MVGAGVSEAAIDDASGRRPHVCGLVASTTTRFLVHSMEHEDLDVSTPLYPGHVDCFHTCSARITEQPIYLTVGEKERKLATDGESLGVGDDLLLLREKNERRNEKPSLCLDA